MAIPKTEHFEHHTTWQAGIIIKSVSDVWRGDSTSTNILVSKKKRVTLEPVQHKESHVMY